MRGIIPSWEADNQDAIIDEIPIIVIENMTKIKTLEAEIKRMKKEMAPHLEALAEAMSDMYIEELDLDKVTVTNSKPYTYQRVKGLKDILKTHPDFIIDYPDLVGEVKVKGHVKIKLK